MDKAISNALKSFVTSNGKHCCRFVGVSSEESGGHGNSLSNSQPPGRPPDSLDCHHCPHTQPLDLTGQPQLDSSKCELVTLPSYQPMTSHTFHWGLKKASVVIQALESAYDEMIHWRKNCLLYPMDLLVRA